uniref:Ankyrin-like protein n=1 Tax=Strongyloides papillosus TaxID=174720 RepID=A0A0N5B5K9_STREA
MTTKILVCLIWEGILLRTTKNIELPGYILKIFDCLRDSNIWVRDIFGGFPNLNEVVFWLQYHNRRHCGYSEDRNIMKRIIESLAEKENGTIIFSYMRSNKNTLCKSNTGLETYFITKTMTSVKVRKYNNENVMIFLRFYTPKFHIGTPFLYTLIENIKELYGFCREQDAKIKLELYSDRTSEVAKSVHIKNPDVDINGVKFSINDLVTSYRLVNYRLNSFLKCMEDFHIYKNLKVLNILLHHFEISDDDKNTCMSNLGRYSFKLYV